MTHIYTAKAALNGHNGQICPSVQLNSVLLCKKGDLPEFNKTGLQKTNLFWREILN